MEPASQKGAQESADRIRLLRDELAGPELQQVLALTPEQQSRFDLWSQARLTELAQRFDVDTTASQKRVSWGMRIVSTLGGLAICAAAVLFFSRYWGYLGTPAQVAITIIAPLLSLVATEIVGAREKTLYFTGLLALLTFSLFVLNLATLGSIFNIESSERALLVWGVFALLLAYRHGLRLQLVLGLLLLISYASALVTAQFGYRWLDFGERPELLALLAAVVFCVPFVVEHQRHIDFPPVYRLTGTIVFFGCLMVLSDWAAGSYLPFEQSTIEGFYEYFGLLCAGLGIWLGIRRQWNGVVNTSATAFVIFLFTRLYKWWWDVLPKYLFFALIGALGIGMVLAFKRVRMRMVRAGAAA